MLNRLLLKNICSDKKLCSRCIKYCWHNGCLRLTTSLARIDSMTRIPLNSFIYWLGCVFCRFPISQFWNDENRFICDFICKINHYNFLRDASYLLPLTINLLFHLISRTSWTNCGENFEVKNRFFRQVYGISIRHRCRKPATNSKTQFFPSLLWK